MKETKGFIAEFKAFIARGKRARHGGRYHHRFCIHSNRYLAC